MGADSLLCNISFGRVFAVREIVMAKKVYREKGSLLTTLRTGTVPGQAGQPINSLNVSDLRPATYSIQFQSINNEEFVPLCEATIVWKVDGQSLTRRITVLDGTVITGLCEGVSVSLRDVTNLFYSIPPDPPKEYYIMVTICKNTRPSEANAPVLYTLPQAQINPGNAAIFPVPRGSGVMAYRVLATTHQAETELRTVVARCTGVAPTFFYFPLLDNSWIPITPGAEQVLVNNESTTRECTAGVIWAIEG